MSAAAFAVLPMTSSNRIFGSSRPVVDRRQKKKKKERPTAFKVRRNPTPRMRNALLFTATTLVEEGYTYREAQHLLRAFFLEMKVSKCKGNKTHAAKELGITRAHLRIFLERGEKLVKS